MARIDIKALAHSYVANPTSEKDYALSRLNLRWENGKAYALLGPSGCGKTTLLNIISGLVNPSEGTIFFDEQDVTLYTTQQRNIAQVFQFPVIYDTMTVFDNLAFPLRNRKIPESNIKSRVEEVAKLLDLHTDLKKRAKGLTADVKQMVSLGRGLVRHDVSAILFDEPLTVIDPHLKWIVRRRLKQIQEQFNVTMVLVTHDQTEALTFADEVVLMHGGSVIQQGTPEELFNYPAHTFVGFFIGSPGMNFLPCRVENTQVHVSGTVFSIPEALAQKASQTTGDLKLGIRPDYCQMADKTTQGAFPALVKRVENLGDFLIVHAKLGENMICAKTEITQSPSVGSDSWFQFPKEHIRLYHNDLLI